MSDTKTSKLYVYTVQHSMRSNRAVFTLQEVEFLDGGDRYACADTKETIFLAGRRTILKAELPYFANNSESGNSFLYYVSETRDDAAARKGIEEQISLSQARIKEEYLRAKQAFDSANIVFPPILGAIRKDPQDMS